MIVDPDFLMHWKTQMLVVELNDPAAPLYVLALWGHCQARRKSQFDSLPPNALKAICRYSGDATLLRDALTSCGFLDQTETGFTVHGWAEANSRLIAQWGNGNRGGRPNKPTENPPKTHGEPTDNPALKREEESRVDGEEEREETAARVPDSVIPSVAEVIAFGAGCTPVIPADYCRTQHAKHSEDHRWITPQGRLIDWRQKFRRYWSADKERWGQKPWSAREEKPRKEREIEV